PARRGAPGRADRIQGGPRTLIVPGALAPQPVERRDETATRYWPAATGPAPRWRTADMGAAGVHRLWRLVLVLQPEPGPGHRRERADRPQPVGRRRKGTGAAGLPADPPAGAMGGPRRDHLPRDPQHRRAPGGQG